MGAPEAGPSKNDYGKMNDLEDGPPTSDYSRTQYRKDAALIYYVTQQKPDAFPHLADLTDNDDISYAKGLFFLCSKKKRAQWLQGVKATLDGHNSPTQSTESWTKFILRFRQGPSEDSTEHDEESPIQQTIEIADELSDNDSHSNSREPEIGENPQERLRAEELDRLLYRKSQLATERRTPNLLTIDRILPPRPTAAQSPDHSPCTQTVSYEDLEA